MRSQSRSVRPKNVGAFVLYAALALVFVLGIVFSNTLFSLFSALPGIFSEEPAGEYALLPRELLASRLADAEAALSRVHYQSVITETLIAENRRLRRELGFLGPDLTGIGRVVVAPPRTNYDTLLVALSDDNTVMEGDLALFESVLVGRVVKTGGDAALVELFTAPGITFDVRVGEPAAIVVAHGVGGGAFVFDVSSDVTLALGAAVVSATHEARLMGTVKRVTADPDRTTARVHAAAPAAPANIRFLEFVRPTPRAVPDGL